MTWYRDNLLVTDLGHPNVNNSLYSLVINKVKKKHIGNYSCEARNNMGHDLDTIWLSGWC